ncbi:RapZ C-terminal domain-containing protein [Streptomyces aculeolatus]
MTITSYAPGHHDPPRSANPIAVDTASLRDPLADPEAISKRLPQMTGLEREMAFYVMTSPGAERLSERAFVQVWDRVIDGRPQVDVHVACADGRRRSVAVAEHLAERLRALRQDDINVDVVHRHIHHPLLLAETER